MPYQESAGPCAPADRKQGAQPWRLPGRNSPTGGQLLSPSWGDPSPQCRGAPQGPAQSSTLRGFPDALDRGAELWGSFSFFRVSTKHPDFRPSCSQAVVPIGLCMSRPLHVSYVYSRDRRKPSNYVPKVKKQTHDAGHWSRAWALERGPCARRGRDPSLPPAPGGGCAPPGTAAHVWALGSHPGHHVLIRTPWG